jgi:hypothetical protein
VTTTLFEGTVTDVGTISAPMSPTSSSRRSLRPDLRAAESRREVPASQGTPVEPAAQERFGRRITSMSDRGTSLIKGFIGLRS